MRPRTPFPRSLRHRPRLSAAICLVAASAIAMTVLPAAAVQVSSQAVGPVDGQARLDVGLDDAFRASAREFHVPRDLLVAVAYSETHFDDHEGLPSADLGYGVMHLVDNPRVDTVNRASRLTGTSEAALRSDRLQNVRGGAALLAAYADQMQVSASDRGDLDVWYSAVARYSNASDERVARLYADTVYGLLESGLRAQTPRGETVVLHGRNVTPKRGSYDSVPSLDVPDARSQSQTTKAARTTAATDYPGANWVPAYSGNYTNASRSGTAIKYVVIHTTQGSYSGAISWFQNRSANVSAHYVVRSSDGQITQTVREEDIGWHAGNWTYNQQSIGIEHEGWVDQPAWYTDAMYRSSAALVRSICDRYGIPKTRERILGHSQVAGSTHTDPGRNWDWDYFLSLVSADAAVKSWRTVVDNADQGRFSAAAPWKTSTWNSDRFGSDYRYAQPSAGDGDGDAAWFRVRVPETGRYAVFVRYPADAGYNSKARLLVQAVAGQRVFEVNQQVNGGRWVRLAAPRLAAGDHDVLGVSRDSDQPGYVVADAVRLVRK